MSNDTGAQEEGEGMVETAVLLQPSYDLVERTPVLDKGHLDLVAVDADDLDVVNAARVSFHVETATMTDKDQGLIRYLMREKHGTPFEHNYFKFRVKAPLFVFREWHRHRVGHSYNEWSARYSQLENETYIPRANEVLTQFGKPGAYTYEPIDHDYAVAFIEDLIKAGDYLYSLYEKHLGRGVARQQARLFLGVNIYSEMIWTCNARSLMHFLSLRNAPNAQPEIRAYAEAAEAFFLKAMPVTAQAFIDNGRIAP